jgi:hypothetical protein
MRTSFFLDVKDSRFFEPKPPNESGPSAETFSCIYNRQFITIIFGNLSRKNSSRQVARMPLYCGLPTEDAAVCLKKAEARRQLKMLESAAGKRKAMPRRLPGGIYSFAGSTDTRAHSIRHGFHPERVLP